MDRKGLLAHPTFLSFVIGLVTIRLMFWAWGEIFGELSFLMMISLLLILAKDWLLFFTLNKDQAKRLIEDAGSHFIKLRGKITIVGVIILGMIVCTTICFVVGLLLYLHWAIAYSLLIVETLVFRAWYLKRIAAT